MKTRLLLIGLLAIASASFAKTELKEYQIKGVGADRSEAITNAIKLAAGKIYGIDVQTGDQQFRFDSKVMDKNIRYFDYSNVSINSTGTNQTLSMEGLIKSFEVVEEKQIAPDQYEVILKVWAHDYSGYENKDKIRLALMPIDGQNLDANSLLLNVSDMLLDKITQKLADSGQFAILDRVQMQKLEKEMRLITSSKSAVEEKAKAGKLIGSDYIVVGEIKESVFASELKMIKITGRTSQRYKVRFECSFSVIETATGITKFTTNAKQVLDDTEVRALFDKWEPDKITDRDIASKVLDVIADEVLAGFSQHFNPVRVLAVSNDQVILRNPSWLSENDTLGVYEVGEEITDYDTGEVLGNTETLKYKIQIVTLMPKIAYAKVLSGDINDINRGDICRLVETKPVETLQSHPCCPKQNGVERTPNGGVVLPFDRK